MNWTNCPLYSECEIEYKDIMTFCEIGCNNPKKRELTEQKDKCPENNI